MKFAATIMMVLVTSVPVAKAESFAVAKDGKTECVIVTSLKPTPEETTAASWLAELLQRATGATFAIKTEDAADLPATRFCVGDTAVARAAGIESQKLKPEEWRVKCDAKLVILTGGRPRGTIYAVSEFLEEQAGMLMLDPFADFVPSKPTLELEPIDRAGRPAFPVRALFTGFPYSHAANDGRLIERYRVWNKNTIWASTAAGDCTRMVPEGVHSFGHFISSKEYAQTHPEYFGMDASGKRVTDDLGTPSAWTQLCVTNPDVRRIVLDRSKKFLLDDQATAKKNGREPSSILTLSQNDNTANLCLCSDCKAIADREGSESGPLLDFVNHIARGIKDEFPNVIVQTEAYNFTLTAPKTIKPDVNVLVRFCDNYGFSDSTHPLTHPRNERAKKLFDEWRSKGCQLGVWDYWRVFPQHPTGFFAPNSNVLAMSRDIPFFRQSGVELMTIEIEDLFGAGLNAEPTSFDLQSFMPLRTWIGMKLLDNLTGEQHHSRARQNVGVAPSNIPTATTPPSGEGGYLDTLLTKFCSAYYGPAATPMRALLDRIESRQQEVALRIVDVQRHVWAEQFCDAAFMLDANRLLDEALQLTAENPTIQTRVRRERIVIDSTFLWLDEHLREQASKIGGAFPKRADILARHRADWHAYIRSVFNADGLKIVEPFIENSLALSEKLRPEDTMFEHRSSEITDKDVTLDGQLTEAFWKDAPVARLLPRDPQQPNDNTAKIRTAWTADSLYVGIEHPADQAPAHVIVSLMAADRKGIQLDLSFPRRPGPQPLNGYFYSYDRNGSLQVVKDHKSQSQCVGATDDTHATTELRILWTDIAETPTDKRDYVFNVLTYPNPDSKVPSHTLSPWLVGTQPTWHSGYWSSLRLVPKQ